MNLKKRLNQTNEELRMPHTDPALLKIMGEKITSWLPRFPHEYVVVCIGTDRSTGDALGPMTGTILSKMKPRHITVYGTLHEPVHATNLMDYTNLIKEKHRNAYIIAIDACLGQTSSVGHLITGLGPIKPGAALNKTLPSIGNMHITGVVNISGFMEFSVLQNTRLSIVMDMSEIIAGLLNNIDQRLKHHYPTPAIVIQREAQKGM